MTSPTPQSDRRRAARAAATFPLQLSTKAESEPASMRDLSEIGLACTASHPVAEMTMVGVDFALPGATERHQVKGAVVRCEPMRGGAAGAKQWDVAIYFTEITATTRAAVRNYVQKGKQV